MAAVRERQAQLTKPAGSLGRLEALALQLAGIAGCPLPALADKTVLILAADHGVAAEGVSLYPQAVTRQMVENFLRGGAAINVLAHAAGARLVVADFGVASGPRAIAPRAIVQTGDTNLPKPVWRRQRGKPVLHQTSVTEHFSEHVRYVATPLARGTENLATGPAMSRDLAVQAIEAGVELLDAEYARGLDAVATGDMGIANTTASSCLVATLAGAPVEQVTGRGTGLDDQQLAHKRAIVVQALAVNRPDAADPLDVLAKVGGLEIAGLAGVMLGAARRRVAIVLDGFITGAAALVASRLCPAVTPYMIAAHCSVEPGHGVTLDALQLQPLLDLGLRLGEGTGAALALPILDAACRTLAEMATFAAAGVAMREE